MNNPVSNQTVDIKGKRNTLARAGWKTGCAVALLGFGILVYWFWYRHFLATPMEPQANPAHKEDAKYRLALAGAFISFGVAAYLLYNRHIYLDLYGRRLVTAKHLACFKISKRSQPLTDFSNIVVHHVCDARGEGPDTYSGKVGLKPVDGGSVLWLDEFPVSQNETP